MTVDPTIKKYAKQAMLMQVATVHQSMPWICTVYFVVDDKLRFYWLSLPSRRHSREIAQHDKVAIAVAVKPDQPIIGLQAEGRAEVVQDPLEVQAVITKYIAKYNMGHKFMDAYRAGENQHQLYRFTPKSIVLMDEVNAREKGRQEWHINKPL